MSATDFSFLEDWDKCSVVNNAIARRAASRKILTLVPDQPYLNRSLKQVINSATNPNYDERYRSANDMINALNNLYFPNWTVTNGSYCADSWKGWDWIIETVCKRTGTEVQIKRSRSGKNAFRRWNIESTLADAFNKVLRDG